MTSLLLAGLLALVAADADSTQPPSIIDQPAITYPSETPEVPSTEDEDPVATALEEMSLRKKVAQLMVVTMSGSHQPSVEDLAYLKTYTPGAAIIRKILRPSYASVYVAKLRGVEQLSGIPLWVGTNIYRLTAADREELSEFIQLPSPLSLAAANDPATTEALAELLAQHLNLMGFNLHLGPSLELAPSIKDAVGSIYNLGSDPYFIGDTFNITQRVFRDRGIIAVPLGFPGGGANRLEKSPAVLLTPVAQLAQQDLLPYHRVIANQTPLVHVGNTLVPTLDSSGLPACVSPVVLRQMLRNDLAYEGIILAGPMDTQDVSGIIDPAEAAIRALTHGADMIMWDGADSQEMRAVDRIVSAVDEGRLSEALIDTALKRVLDYKFEHLMEQVAKTEKDAAPLERTKKLAEQVQAIEERAITIVQNNGNLLPLSKEKSMPIGITGTIGVEVLHASMEKHIKHISQQPITTARHVGEIKDFEIHRVTSHIRGIRTVVCVFGETDRPEGQVRLVRELKAKGAQVVVVLLGYPRNLPYLAEADAIVLAYCDSSKFSQTLVSMADVLVGEGAVRFITVDKEIAVNVGESRTFNAYDFMRVPAGRLPITLSKSFSVGQAIPYSPETAVKKLQWNFGDGKKSKDPRTVHAFKKAGHYPVNLSVTTQDGNTTYCTFHVVANEVQ